ncbi:MAG: lactonase family protein [Thermomicrobiales bacterium]
MDLYIGSYTSDDVTGPQGITRFSFDPDSGAIERLDVALDIASPTWITASGDGTRLYAVTEVDGGAVAAIARDPETGGLRELNRVSSFGDSPCYASLTADERFVLVANYSSGTVAVLPVNADGTLGEAVSTATHGGSSVVADRQGEAHAHQIVQSPDGGSVLVCDLGTDQVVVYPFDRTSGQLGEPTKVDVQPGAGPRHLAFAPDGAFVYIIDELDSTVIAATWDGGTQTLTPIQTISTVPADFTDTNYPSQILVSPDGRFVYGANRLHDTVVKYAIEAGSGTLSVIGWAPVGAYPRNIAFDPDASWMIASNQQDSTLTVLARDAASGELQPVGDPIPVPTPAIAVFLP